MGFMDSIKDFVMKNKIGAIIGGALAIPAVMAMVSFMGFLSVIFFGGSLGLTGTFLMIVNIIIGIAAGGFVQQLSREYLHFG